MGILRRSFNNVLPVSKGESRLSPDAAKAVFQGSYGHNQMITKVDSYSVGEAGSRVTVDRRFIRDTVFARNFDVDGGHASNQLFEPDVAKAIVGEMQPDGIERANKVERTAAIARRVIVIGAAATITAGLFIGGKQISEHMPPPSPEHSTPHAPKVGNIIIPPVILP